MNVNPNKTISLNESDSISKLHVTNIERDLSTLEGNILQLQKLEPGKTYLVKIDSSNGQIQLELAKHPWKARICSFFSRATSSNVKNYVITNQGGKALQKDLILQLSSNFKEISDSFQKLSDIVSRPFTLKNSFTKRTQQSDGIQKPWIYQKPNESSTKTRLTTVAKRILNITQDLTKVRTKTEVSLPILSEANLPGLDKLYTTSHTFLHIKNLKTSAVDKAVKRLVDKQTKKQAKIKPEDIGKIFTHTFEVSRLTSK